MLSEYEARELSRAMTRQRDAGPKSLLLPAAGLLIVAMLAVFGGVSPPVERAKEPASRGSPAPVASVSVDAGVPFPSSAAYDARTNMLLVGSYTNGSIQRVSLTGPSAARSTLPHDGRQGVLRIRLDSERGRIWVLGSDRLYLYDSRDSQLLQQIDIGELSQHSSEHCLPDMAVDRSGAVFLSSAMQPVLWRVDPVSFEIDKRKVHTDADQGMDFGFSAVAFDDDGAMYAASATTGALWMVDPIAHTASKLPLSSPISGACALHVVTETAGSPAKILYVAGGFRDTVKRIRLAGHSPLEVADVPTIAPSIVPTDLVQIGQHLMIVSSRLSDHPDFNGEGAQPRPVKIVALKLW